MRLPRGLNTNSQESLVKGCSQRVFIPQLSWPAVLLSPSGRDMQILRRRLARDHRMVLSEGYRWVLAAAAAAWPCSNSCVHRCTRMHTHMHAHTVRRVGIQPQ